MKLFASAAHAARMYNSFHRHKERSYKMKNAIMNAAVAIAGLSLAAILPALFTGHGQPDETPPA